MSRELAARIPLYSTHALVLTGARRAGKSVLQRQLMSRRKTSFYCNLEDTRLYGFGPEDFPAFLSLLEELAPPAAPVFLDEVQEIPEWQRLVRTLLDRRRTVCVTGSNASLLGRELGSKLTGRQLSFEVLPFSYREFVAYTRRKPGLGSLTDHLDHGGFPGYLRNRNPKVLQELLRDVVQRDLALRHQVRETRHAMNLALFLLANTGLPMSLQSLTKALDVPSVLQTSRYLEYLEDAYLIFGLPKFSTSFKRRVVAPRKYFAVDNGLRRTASPQRQPDLGRRLENAVYLELRRRGGALAWAGEKDSWECDFVTDHEAIQVCAELNPETRPRELKGLANACALPGRRRPLLITLDQRDRLQEAGRVVDVVPAWDWLSRPLRS